MIRSNDDATFERKCDRKEPLRSYCNSTSLADRICAIPCISFVMASDVVTEFSGARAKCFDYMSMVFWFTFGSIKGPSEIPVGMVQSNL
jgi:hypothetical protein